MVNIKSLQELAQTSDDHEAYEPVAKGSGFRVGVGARAAPHGAPAVFVEVVLDPFPDRPQVDPERLADHGARMAWLKARGYAVECADDSTITCERLLKPTMAAAELQAVRRMLDRPPRKRRGHGTVSRRA